MFEDEDEDAEVELIRPRRWQWSAAAGVTVNLVGNLGRAMSVWCDDMTTLLAQHTAVRYDRDDLITSVHRDLESLPVDE